MESDGLTIRQRTRSGTRAIRDWPRHFPNLAKESVQGERFLREVCFEINDLVVKQFLLRGLGKVQRGVGDDLSHP